MKLTEFKKRKGLFFLTGATGFLGSNLTLELTKQNYSVIVLIRPHNGNSVFEQFRRVCRFMDIDSNIISRVQIIEGDINIPQLGLGLDQYNHLMNSVTDIINCAASTSFSEKKRELVERTNIYGLQNLLELAVNGNCSFFHQISTAYVFGKTSGICKEELTSPKNFTNVYEETKCRAEHLATEVCERAGIKLNIYRPGIVCGESNEGKTFRFNGLYYPLKSLHRIMESLRVDLLQKGGEKARKMGVRMVDENRLFLPLTIRVSENSGINIIPVDYFVRMFMKILEDRTQGGIFHIVQNENCLSRDLIEYTGRYFDIAGLTTTSGENTEGPLERLFNMYNDAYLPYLKDTRVFSSRNTSHLRAFVPDDRFTYERFKLCVDYALETGWREYL